ncbi:MAG: hypothetical protein J5789_05560 [Oscillospiraceae bacterium]|nr:hypothetical protein [Oscillospiraceae bacterium]
MKQRMEPEINACAVGAASAIGGDGTLRRKQFTFYDSFFKAVSSLPRSRQLETYQAIAAYALYGVEPELTGSARSVFDVIRPILDASRTKAEARIRKQVTGDNWQ